MNRGVVILGIYVTDLTFRAERMPLLGETIAGSAFAMGPGGKGSNQAVAAARAGADVVFCTRLGADAFGDIARSTWAAEGITARATSTNGVATGAAHIFVDDVTGGNAITRRRQRRFSGCLGGILLAERVNDCETAGLLI